MILNLFVNNECKPLTKSTTKYKLFLQTLKFKKSFAQKNQVCITKGVL